MWADNHKYSSTHRIYSRSATIVVFLLTAGCNGFPSVSTCSSVEFFSSGRTEKPKDHWVKVRILITYLLDPKHSLS